MTKRKKLSPYGCQHCGLKVTDDFGQARCGVTGFKTPFTVNAPYHCNDFIKDPTLKDHDPAQPSDDS